MIGVLALLAQMILPVIFSVTVPALNVLGFSSVLVPLVVIYASLELGDERAPLIAAVLGLLLDLTSSSHLGTSVLILVSLSDADRHPGAEDAGPPLDLPGRLRPGRHLRLSAARLCFHPGGNRAVDLAV